MSDRARGRCGACGGRLLALAGLLGGLLSVAGCAAPLGGANLATSPVTFRIQGQVVDPGPPRSVQDAGYPSTWNLSMIGLASGYPQPLPGAAEVVVALVDTGSDPRQPSLQGHLLPLVDLLGHNDTYTDGEGRHDYAGEDGNGHGTHVAGIVAGVLGQSGVEILPVKAIGNDGVGNDGDIARGIRDAVDWRNSADPQQRVRVINLSLGGNRSSGTLQDAIDYAVANGVLVVAAAGNHAGGVDFPASLPEVVAVSATTALDTLASYSDRGPEISISAPGGDENEPVWSTWPSYLTASDLRSGVVSIHLTSGMMGTSMSSPHVAAAAGLLFAQDPALTVDQVRNRLLTWATNLGPVGPNPYFGVGRLQVLRAIDNVSADAE